MANSNIDALFPEFWAVSFDSPDIGTYNFQNLVSRDVEPLLASSGDTVNVPLTPDLDNAEDWEPGSEIVATAVAQKVAKVILNKSKKKTISLTGKELSLSPYKLIEKYGVPLAKSIIKSVNMDIYCELLKTTTIIDGMTTFNEDTVVSAKTALSKNEISMVERVLVCGPDDTDKMLKLDAFQHVDISGDQSAMVDGLIRRKFGFDIYENNIIETYKPSTLEGSVGSAFNVGDASGNVAGIDDSDGPLREGDIIRFEGEAGNPIHVITETTRDVQGRTTEIAFIPAVSSLVSVGSTLTITPSRSMLGFVPSCCAFAARSYEQLPVGVNTAIYDLRGLPVRICVWHDGKLGLNVQYDILYGAKMVNPRRVVRILR